eukprot:CAMPEP_0185525586 /NCGR_PEP_ID=MMETSP1366-20130426/91108_1 /TAXON_ID=38817 /ORGANISM="Gephyrocapsa oceanica, Strain RCC1303" /LENGTH=37 /DNA_ID= /DNA_START= /DNA_END= /DNA_ORIENTATION=
MQLRAAATAILDVGAHGSFNASISACSIASKVGNSSP